MSHIRHAIDITLHEHRDEIPERAMRELQTILYPHPLEDMSERPHVSDSQLVDQLANWIGRWTTEMPTDVAVIFVDITAMPHAVDVAVVVPEPIAPDAPGAEAPRDEPPYPLHDSASMVLHPEDAVAVEPMPGISGATSVPSPVQVLEAGDENTPISADHA